MLAANYYQSLVALNLSAPTIVYSSPSQISAVGSTVSLVAFAVGAPPLAYQWYRNNLPIPGGTNSELRLSGAFTAQAGTNDYFAVVSNAAGSVTNFPITVRLQPGLTVQWCPAITLYGEVTKEYLIQSTPSLGSTNPWSNTATVTITNIPQILLPWFADRPPGDVLPVGSSHKQVDELWRLPPL